MSTTRRPSKINIIVRILQNGTILVKSNGTSYEVSRESVYVLPREMKEMSARWDNVTKKYVTLTTHGEVVLLDDDTLPSSLNMTIKYSGASAEKFISLLSDILRKYYRGQNVLQLPLSDRLVHRFAVMLMRMANLQSISDV